MIERMKYLGLDYGSKRIGIAVSDGEGTIAFPRTTLTNDQTVMDELAAIIEVERIRCIVVGDTRAFGGGANTVTPEADRFAARLETQFDIPVKRAFEAWSSREATRFLNAEKHDESAASIILQRFLDMHGRSDGASPKHE